MAFIYIFIFCPFQTAVGRLRRKAVRPRPLQVPTSRETALLSSNQNQSPGENTAKEEVRCMKNLTGIAFVVWTKVQVALRDKVNVTRVYNNVTEDVTMAMT